LEELAMAGVLTSIPPPAPERSMAMLRRGLAKYAEAGITTAQDGASSHDMLTLLAAADAAGALPIDVVAYPMYTIADEGLLAEIATAWRQPGRFRIGGIKITIDGSIQGYTAFLGQPYHRQPGGADLQGRGCDSEAGARMVAGPDGSASGAVPAPIPQAPGGDHRGYPSMPQEAVTQWLATCDAAGIPLLCHCNGDAAVDMLLEAVGAVRADGARPDLRTVIIHAQTIRDDQLDVAADHGLVPSFFPIHVSFWGDRHRDIFLGPERAARIDPARSALDRGMRITLHHDAPVAGISMLAVVSAAVNRRTTGGAVLGPDEAITPYEAFRAITADAAWQYFEEDRKGTLEAGKLADLVVLSDDPFAVDPETIGGIRVVETIKEGTTVFEAAEG
jgi:predicted amidohydrolase YtcJ